VVSSPITMPTPAFEFVIARLLEDPAERFPAIAANAPPGVLVSSIHFARAKKALKERAYRALLEARDVEALKASPARLLRENRRLRVKLDRIKEVVS